MPREWYLRCNVEEDMGDSYVVTIEKCPEELEVMSECINSFPTCKALTIWVEKEKPNDIVAIGIMLKGSHYWMYSIVDVPMSEVFNTQGVPYRKGDCDV